MPKIVLVDDDPDIHQLLGSFLSTDGHDVTSLTDGSQLPDLVAGGQVDLVLVDLNMPGLRGTDLIRRLKAEGAQAKVVLFSAADESELRRLARASGADGYVQKGLDPPLLLLRLARFLRG